MITREVTGEYIRIIPNGVIEYRRVETIKDGEQVLATTNWRTTYTPGTAIEELPESVQAHANIAWTPEVIQAYQDALNDV